VEKLYWIAAKLVFYRLWPYTLRENQNKIGKIWYIPKDIVRDWKIFKQIETDDTCKFEAPPVD